MKLIVHIGMGKTGTSSIQQAMRGSGPELDASGAAYLGMWLTDVDPAFARQAGQRLFFAAGADDMVRHADTFAKAMEARRAQTGAARFVLSNEGFFGRVAKMTPFLKALEDRMDVSLIAYVRDPRSWLPSAYTQWGIRHKENAGPVQPFAERAATLIRQYKPLRIWMKNFGDQLDVRAYEKGLNVVQDFASAVDLPLSSGEKRFLERGEPAEVLLRALFNDRFEEPVMPERFASAVTPNGMKQVRSVSEMAARCFDHAALDALISERQADFDYIRDEIGIDLMAGPAPQNTLPDQSALQDRMVDYLTDIVLKQSVRLRRLERDVADLTAHSDKE